MSDNTVKQITTDDLRHMEGQEGLVLQGCGGDPQEWVDGINRELTEAGILLGGSKLENVVSFRHDGVTCLLFPFGDAELNIGKFAMWRIQTHDRYGGTWLSDLSPTGWAASSKSSRLHGNRKWIWRAMMAISSPLWGGPPFCCRWPA